MKYSRFEELPVWQDSIELAVTVYRFTAHSAFKGRYTLKDQLERASVSIPNNIAEGFERGTTQETLTFLYIARGYLWACGLTGPSPRCSASVRCGRVWKRTR